MSHNSQVSLNSIGSKGKATGPGFLLDEQSSKYDQPQNTA